MKSMCSLAVIVAAASVGMAQEGMQPSEEHKILKKCVGDRTGIMQMWLQGPESDPVAMPFTEKNKAMLNDFWVETEFECGPYKGHGLAGYDPAKKKYVGTWTNNMTPYMSIMEGTYDESTHELTMLFRDFDVATGTFADMKSVTAYPPGKAETMTMYKKDATSGKWVRSFVMTYNSSEKQ